MAGLLAGPAPALAGGIIPEWVQPAPGTYVAPFVGVHDDLLALGLVQTVSSAGHTDVAEIGGFEGLSSSSIHSLSFAVGPLPSGINPCWLVTVTKPDGTVVQDHVVASGDETFDQSHTALPGGFTQWTWTPQSLPQGTVDEVIIGVMDQAAPANPQSVVFDEFAANGASLDLLGLL